MISWGEGKQLPPPAPPYTGGELITKYHDTSMQLVLPLCKGELEGGAVYF